MKQELSDDLIRAYLNGKLSSSETVRIEKILQDNPDLQQEVSLRRAEMGAAELLIASETRQLFRQWQQEAAPHRSVFRGGPLRWAIGIAIGALFVFAVWRMSFRPADSSAPTPDIHTPTPAPRQPVAAAPTAPAPATQPAPPSAQRPSKNYWALAKQQLPDPLSTTLRRVETADSSASIFQQAQDAYAVGKYQQTLDLLGETEAARQQSAAFLSAHALFQLRRPQEAAAAFEGLIAQNSRQFRYRSEWGLLICRLANRPNSEKEFKKQLKEILAQPEHPYFEQAKALQKTLSK